MVAEPGGYRHRGIDISAKVGGLGELALEEGFRMHPEDIDALGLKNQDCITISLGKGKINVTGTVKSDGECPKSVIYYTRPVVFGGLKDRQKLVPLYVVKENPVRIKIYKAEA